jgi:hypothetical protein
MLTTVKATIHKAFTASDLGRSLSCSVNYFISAGLCSTLLFGVSVWSGFAVSSANAREQWQMQHPEGDAPTGPVGKGWVPAAPGSVPGLVGSGQPSNGQSSTGMAPGLIAPGLPGYGSGSGL